MASKYTRCSTAPAADDDDDEVIPGSILASSASSCVMTRAPKKASELLTKASTTAPRPFTATKLWGPPRAAADLSGETGELSCTTLPPVLSFNAMGAVVAVAVAESAVMGFTIELSDSCPSTNGLCEPSSSSTPFDLRSTLVPALLPSTPAAPPLRLATCEVTWEAKTHRSPHCKTGKTCKGYVKRMATQRQPRTACPTKEPLGKFSVAICSTSSAPNRRSPANPNTPRNRAVKATTPCNMKG
mmetsp:Transcript_37724/g.68954  ORF Transcript_37724/g.68954 Transcript_37724/m.68954 type:complete len:243 (+) Transcript_37724:365-1093(+)